MRLGMEVHLAFPVAAAVAVSVLVEVGGAFA